MSLEGIAETQTTMLQIPVSWIDPLRLLSKEKRIVTDELIKIYSPNIRGILSQSPLRIWVNPNDPNEMRVIDGLHRLFSVEEYNKLHPDEVIGLVPCIIESYSKEKFLQQRKQQTINHSTIADYRCIDWLIGAFNEETFGLAPEKKVPLEKLLNLYISLAKDPGKNFLSTYKIKRADLNKMQGFIEDWITQYNVKGLAAYDIYRVIQMVGKDNLEILGLAGMTRDYVKLAYGCLKNIQNVSEKREYTSHIIRVALTAERPRGIIQSVAKVFNEGNNDYRQRMLNAVNYLDAKHIYEDFKLEYSPKEEKAAVKPINNFNEESDISGPFLLVEDLDEEEMETETDIDEPDIEALKSVEEEFKEDLFPQVLQSPQKHEKKHAAHKNLPIKFSFDRKRGSPGEIFFDSEKSSLVDGYRPTTIEILNGAFYITYNTKNSERFFLRIKGPYSFETFNSNGSKPKIYAVDNIEAIFMWGSEEDPGLPTVDKYIREITPVKRNAGSVIAQSAMKRSGMGGIARLVKSDIVYIPESEAYIFATPEEVLKIVGKSNVFVNMFYKKLGDTIHPAGRYSIIKDLPGFVNILENIIKITT